MPHSAQAIFQAIPRRSDHQAARLACRGICGACSVCSEAFFSMGGRRFVGPGVGIGIGAGCTLFGVGWGFGGAPIGLWGMGAGGGCGVGIALLGWGTGVGFGAEYLRKDMLMGGHSRSFWRVVQNKWDHTRQLEEQEEE